MEPWDWLFYLLSMFVIRIQQLLNKNWGLYKNGHATGTPNIGDHLYFKMEFFSTSESMSLNRKCFFLISDMN